MGIIVKGADSGRGRNKGATAATVGETLARLGNPRLNTAFYRLINRLPDHPLTLKQARIVNVGKLLVPPSPSLEPAQRSFLLCSRTPKRQAIADSFCTA